MTGVNNNPTAANFYNANGGVAQQGSQLGGTIGSAVVTFPTSGGVPGVTWTAAGPVFSNTGQVNCGNGLAPVAPIAPGAPAKNPGTCAITTIDPHWRLPYVQEWNIGIQHQLASRISLDLAYVGSHGTNLLDDYDLNRATPGSNSSTRVQQSRTYYSQFPWFGRVLEVTNKDYSNFDALQATLTMRAWHGLSSTAGYTFGHTLDSEATDLDTNICVNPQTPNCNYGPTPFDIRHRFTDRIVYDLPSIKSPAQLLEGWEVATVINVQSATPYDAFGSTDNISGTGENTDRWDIFGSAKDFYKYGRTTQVPCWGVAGSTFAANIACTSVPTIAAMQTAAPACYNAANNLPGGGGLTTLAAYGCYMAGSSVIIPPAYGTFGNMGKGMLRGDPFRIADLSIVKRTKITERVSSEFRFDVFNLTNHPEYAIPGGNGNTSFAAVNNPSIFGFSAATPNVSNGNVVEGSGDGRRLQFGLKMMF